MSVRVRRSRHPMAMSTALAWSCCLCPERSANAGDPRISRGSVLSGWLRIYNERHPYGSLANKPTVSTAGLESKTALLQSTPSPRGTGERGVRLRVALVFEGSLMLALNNRRAGPVIRAPIMKSIAISNLELWMMVRYRFAHR